MSFTLFGTFYRPGRSCGGKDQKKNYKQLQNDVVVAFGRFKPSSKASYF